MLSLNTRTGSPAAPGMAWLCAKGLGCVVMCWCGRVQLHAGRLATPTASLCAGVPVGSSCCESLLCTVQAMDRFLVCHNRACQVEQRAPQR